MLSILAFAAMLSTATPSPVAGPAGWTPKPMDGANILGVWLSPTLDPDVTFRANVTLTVGESTVADEEKSRDQQIAKMGATLVRDKAVQCRDQSARALEYVITKPAPIDTIMLLVQNSPTQLLLASYQRPVGMPVDVAVTTWLQRLCDRGDRSVSLDV